MVCLIQAFTCGAQSWSPVGLGLNNVVQTLEVDTVKNILYAGGWFTSFPGDFSNQYRGIAQWDGSNWSALGTGQEFFSAKMKALRMHNGELYVGGESLKFLIDTANSISCDYIVKWSGTSWEEVGLGFGGTLNTPMVSEIEVYNNEVIAGGDFITIKDSIQSDSAWCVASWDGADWDTLGKGVKANPWFLTTLRAMGVYQGELYVGGGFHEAGGLPASSMARWDGTSWSEVGGYSGWPQPRDFIVYKNELYMGGIGNEFMKWDGIGWNTVTVIPQGGIYALAIYNGDLVVAGGFDTINGMPANCIASYDGTNWTTFGLGLTHTSGGWGAVEALTVMDNVLYAGGWFDMAGGDTAYYVAKWSEPVGIEQLANNKEQIKVYPNPTTGKFRVESSEFRVEKVEVFDLFGRLLLCSNEEQIDMSSYPAGLYIWRVGNTRGKVVIE